MNRQIKLQLTSIFGRVALFAVILFQTSKGAAEESRWQHFKDNPGVFSFERATKMDPIAVKNSWLDSGEFLDESKASRLKLSLVEYLNVVRRRNEKIIFQELEKKIASASTINARSIYDKELTMSLDRESIRELNSTEEALARSSSTEYIKKTNTLNVGIGSLISSGARLKMDYLFEDDVNNLQSPALSGDEITTSLGFTVTQPLLKNFGSEVVNANIYIAEEEQEIAVQTYRQTLMEVIFTAVKAYIDQQLSQEKHQARKSSVQLAEGLLADNKRQFELGQKAEIEVLEAEAGLAQRRSSELVARNDVSVAENTMRQLLLLSVMQNRLGLEAGDAMIKVEPYKPDLKKSLKIAFEKQPEFLARKLKIIREGIRVDYAKNQMLPQLDLKAGFTLNGFGKTTTNSMNSGIFDQYNTWNIGAEFSIPLGGEKSESEYSAAKYREKQSLLDFHVIEVAIINNLDVSIRLVENSYKQWQQASLAVATRDKLLKKELDALRVGTSNSRQVLDREESLLNAKDVELDKNVAYQKALLGVYLAEGTLLEKFAIEKVKHVASLQTNGKVLSQAHSVAKPKVKVKPVNHDSVVTGGFSLNDLILESSKASIMVR